VRGVLFTFGVAVVSFALLFTGMIFHFWFQMALTVSGLCLMAFLFSPATAKDLFVLSGNEALRAPVLGLLSAAILYGVFFAGGRIATILFSSARAMVSDVYALKAGASPGLITFLLICIIGPGEEIFWRGFFQKQLEEKYGFYGVLLAVAAYTLIHLPSGNPMLIVAAAVCGGFWGLFFYYFRSIWANIISHAAWDVAIFLLWPINC